MSKPSSTQLSWLLDLSSNYKHAHTSFYKHVSNVSWDDKAFLNTDKDILLTLDFRFASTLLYKFLHLILKFNPLESNNDLLYLYIRENLAAFLLEPKENIETIYEWLHSDAIKLIDSSDGHIYIYSHKYNNYVMQNKTETLCECKKTLYLTIKDFLYANTENTFYYKDLHSKKNYDHEYIYPKNTLQQCSAHISSAQIKWLECALLLETSTCARVEIVKTLNSISWDTPEFLGVCKYIFYSAHFETAWSIAIKYIELSIKLKASTPVANNELMYFLYKNLGKILRNSTQNLILVLTWFETVQIPPRTLKQLLPSYEADFISGLNVPVDASSTSNHDVSANSMQVSQLLNQHWTAERTVYKTLNEFLKLQGF